jgi:hypothetical protein
MGRAADAGVEPDTRAMLSRISRHTLCDGALRPVGSVNPEASSLD